MQGARVLLDAPTIFVSRIGDIYRKRNRPLFLILRQLNQEKRKSPVTRGIMPVYVIIIGILICTV